MSKTGSVSFVYMKRARQNREGVSEIPEQVNQHWDWGESGFTWLHRELCRSLDSPAAMILHTENMFPSLEPGDCSWDGDRSSFSLCLPVITASWLQREVNALVTDDTFTPHGKVHFIEFIVTRWSPEPRRPAVTLRSTFGSLNLPCVRALIQNCCTSNTVVFHSRYFFIPPRNH